MLTIYKASAGSGKTYRLTFEYLKLLFMNEFDTKRETGQRYGDGHRHILAVTFTNKATEEMKRRVIVELNTLAHSPQQSGYTEEFCRLFRVNVSALQLSAKEILYRLLHDFSSFNISTIDSFFQQTTRAFTREIGLQGGYNLELDSTRVLTESIDSMMFDLENPQNKDLLQWLIKFSEEKIEDGANWNTNREMLELGAELFKENYKRFSKKLLEITSDKTFLKSYAKELQNIADGFEEACSNWAKQALEIIQRNGLEPESFSGGSRSPFKIIATLAQGNIRPLTKTFLELGDNIEKWAAKKCDKETLAAINNCYQGGLNNCILRLIDTFNAYPLYLTAELSRKQVYTLGILSDIERHIQEYEKEHNLLLLSDTNELLNDIIDGSDTPFIYEKIGTRIDHFMIDEFQDTSQMQWKNFFPLFNESLGKEQNNLIVGDVKQSIYRFRNSDWKLLHEGLKDSFRKDQQEEKILNTNWRSCANVIGFNNAFFRLASLLLQRHINDEMGKSCTLPSHFKERYDKRLQEVYHDLYQHISPKNKEKQGQVTVQFFSETTCEETGETTKPEDRILDTIPTTIRELQDRGYRLRDIVILVRQKSEGTAVAERLLKEKAENKNSQYKYDIISDESLAIGNVPFIKLIISALSFLQANDDPLHKALTVYEFNMAHQQLSPGKALNEYFIRQEKEISQYFPDEIVNELSELDKKPLYEMCEKVISIFASKSDSESVYIQFFLDLVLDYTQKYSSDLASFLKWWNESGYRKMIITPQSQDAIRIMTIHKSKGLEFKVVIVPFCDWSIDGNHRNILWCHTRTAPFDQIPIIPLKYSKALSESYYAEDYFEEKIHAYIDNLNLAYVAFTRAEEELILYAPKAKRDNPAGSIGALLYECFSDEHDSKDSTEEIISLQQFFDPEKLIYRQGDLPRAKQTLTTDENTLPTPAYISVPMGKRLRLRLQGKGYFGQNERQMYGNLMHGILSSIHTEKDIDLALKNAVSSGELSETETETIALQLREWISHPQVKEWFSPETKIWNEAEILQPKGIFYRPDRVVIEEDKAIVIDYKFGENELKSHHRQVSNYCALLKEMGYSHTEGYLWYVTLDKLIRV